MSDGPSPARARSIAVRADLVHGVDVVAVDDDRLEAVGRRPVGGRVLDGGHRADRRVLHVLVVLAHEHDRRLPDAAMLSASWNAPMFVVPSPKKQTATWPDLRYWADQAAPSAIGRWAPTIAYEPITPCSTLVRCIDPPLPPRRPVAAAEQLGEDRRHRHAPGERVVVAAVGAERVVVLAHRRGDAGRDRLLADAEVGRAADQALEEQLLGADLEAAGTRPSSGTSGAGCRDRCRARSSPCGSAPSTRWRRTARRTGSG